VIASVDRIGIVTSERRLTRQETVMRLERYRFDGGTAIVTGAASGIGAALAVGLADRGSNLGLIDRNAHGLKEVAEEIRARHPALDVRTYEADLAETDSLAELAARIVGDFDVVTLLVNNAGVALGGLFTQISLEDFDWVMRINFEATVHLTYELLPALRASRGSHLVNMSSLYGLIAPPGQSAYSASKFAIRGFTEVLRHELPTLGVGVTAVHPGGVRTKIAQNARLGAHVTAADVRQVRRDFTRLLTIEPRDAAETILDGVEKRRVRVLVGSSAMIPDVLARITPAHYWSVLSGALRLRLRTSPARMLRRRRDSTARD
jgi:short-subunit dehydrogenase